MASTRAIWVAMLRDEAEKRRILGSSPSVPLSKASNPQIFHVGPCDGLATYPGVEPAFTHM